MDFRDEMWQRARGDGAGLGKAHVEGIALDIVVVLGLMQEGRGEWRGRERKKSTTVQPHQKETASH